MVFRDFITLIRIVCGRRRTNGAHCRHDSEASSFQIGVSRGRRMCSSEMLVRVSHRLHCTSRKPWLPFSACAIVGNGCASPLKPAAACDSRAAPQPVREPVGMDPRRSHTIAPKLVSSLSAHAPSMPRIRRSASR